jgi:serine/threonine protein kinase
MLEKPRTLSVESVCNTLARSRLLPAETIRAARARWLREAGASGADVLLFTKWLATNRIVTTYQADVLVSRREGPLTLGSYKILDRLVLGRMAGVYRATAAGGQTVAIKVLPLANADNAQILARFQREAHNAVGLLHPNCVRAFEAGHEKGMHYIVMEHLQGETLADVLRRRGRLPTAEAVRLLHQALQGLQHLYEQGIVHRDLEPANLMIIRVPGSTDDTTSNSTVKILDIGVGRALFEEVNPNITTSQESLGTPEYRSPEQGRDAHAADVRADIYSLGCVLYHALVGDPPFTSKNPVQLMIKHATENPAPLSRFNVQAPPGLQKVLDGMLAKDPAMRYPTPAQAAQDLRPFCPTTRVRS